MPEESEEQRAVLAVHWAICDAGKRGNVATALSISVGEGEAIGRLAAWIEQWGAYARFCEEVDDRLDGAWTAFLDGRASNWGWTGRTSIPPK